MSDVLKKIRNFMEKEGIPGRDAYELPTSPKTFPDGANYRITDPVNELKAETGAVQVDARNADDAIIHPELLDEIDGGFADQAAVAVAHQSAGHDHFEIFV